jgi:hypothetical protein
MLDITKVHRVSGKTWKRLQVGAGVAALVAVTAELVLVCSYGYTLGSGWGSGALYVSIFGLFTAIYAFGVPAAAGAAQRGFRGLPLMLVMLWGCSAVLQGASVYGYYQDRGEGRRIEAVRAVATKSDAELRYDDAIAKVAALKDAPSVRSAQTSVDGLTARLNGMRQERDQLPDRFRSKRAELTLEIARLEGDLSAAKDRLALAQDRADAESARDKAKTEISASAASVTATGAALTRIGDKAWYRWLRTIAHLAASFLCPLVWLAATHEREKAEEEATGAPRKALGAATSVFVEREPPHLGEIIRLGDPTVFIE